MTDRVAVIRDRLAVLRARIDAAASPGQRVAVLGVTKVFDAGLAADAVAAGIGMLGENYARELADKAEMLSSRSVPADWHMIGPIQRNKVKLLVGRVACYQTVDRIELAEVLARRDPGAAVMVQVNATGEVTKSGVDPAAVPALVDAVGSLGLDVRGLMSLGPTDASTDPRPGFALVRSLVDELALDEASMGMSRDLDAAVREGSTMVRVGTDLFGPRPPRDG